MEREWGRMGVLQVIIMEFGKVIPEAEEALEHSLMMQPQMEQKFTPAALKEMAKDVDKMISRLPYHRSQMPDPIEQFPPLPQSEPQHKARDMVIGKYNPLGQIYRYEQAEFQLQISKPTLKQSSKTEQHIDPQPAKQFSMRDRDSVLAEDSLTNSQIKFPSHNYYIMFDRRHKQEAPKVSRTVCLQRKVQRLQDEVRMLREVGKEKGKGTASTGWHRSDGKMKLQKLLDSIIG